MTAAPSRTPIPGVIYILRNPFHAHAVVKIGRTQGTAEERAAQLSRATGVPAPFKVVYSLFVPDAVLAERLVHRELRRRRVNPRREFFRLPLHDAVDCVQTIARDLERISGGTAAARLYLVWRRGADPKRFVSLLARVLQPHRGGTCTVHVFYGSPRAKALLGLGADWSVQFSMPLLRDLKRMDRYADWSVVADEERILARLMPERPTIPLKMLDY